MSPAQLRMARVALRIGVRDLASMAGVTTATITRYENERGGLLAATRDKLQATLESAGISFLEAGIVASGPGVSLRNSRAAAIDVDEIQVVQYRKNLENDAPPGAGG